MSTAMRLVGNTCTFCGVAIIAVVAIISLAVMAWVTFA
jgi:hypothetical protein